jgi:hypothetical protein
MGQMTAIHTAGSGGGGAALVTRLHISPRQDPVMSLRSFSFVAGVLLAFSTLAAAQQPQRPDAEQTSRYGNPTVPRETQQPQGATGPIDTTSGGVTPASPQGDAPSGMQPFRHEQTGEGQSRETKDPPQR